ncbi:MAG: Adk [Actinobacteria bacterium]|nr:Adk [Actinomycetota bacterium]MEA2534692.1 adenylate kinase [Actinomycetota bacterium]
MRIVLLGPPGAGKGTQAARLAAHLGVPHIATGDMLRLAANADTPLGRRLHSYMDRGELVPDDLTNSIVEERIGQPDAAGGFILDGYPRSVDQAKMLDESLAMQGASLDKAIKFMVTGPEIVKRLSGRLVCPVDGSVYHLVTNPPKVDKLCDIDGTPLVQREDDSEETVLRRLEVYGQRTKPLYDLYGERGILDEVDAIGSTEEVYERLLRAAASGEKK